MAIERKRYWLRHLILILVLAVVLFPMLWLITTSIRRDQAAFSTKLFSSRVTLQHYRNLIIPERSVPRLVLDMQSAVYRTGEFRDKSEESIVKSVNTFLEKLDSLLSESRKIADTVSTRFDGVWNYMKDDGKQAMIEEMERIRSLDVQRVSDRVNQMAVTPQSEGYRAALAKIFPTHALLSDGHLFYVERLGPYASDMHEHIEAYQNTYETVFREKDVLVGILKDIDFPQKDETMELLASTGEYISAISVDYSGWSRREQRRVDRNISALADHIDAELFDSVHEKWRAFSQSFEMASAVWSKLQQANKQLIDRLEQDRITFLGEAQKEYAEALESYEQSKAKIPQLESEIETARTAIRELHLVLDMISPVVVPETEKLRALQTSVTRVLQKAPSSAVSAPPDFVSVVRDMSRSNENLKTAISLLKDAEFEDARVIQQLEALSAQMGWYESRSEELLERHNDPDIRRAFEILRVAVTGIKRVMSGLLDASEQLASINETLNENMTTLEKETEKLREAEALVNALEPSAREREADINRHVEYARLDLALHRASQEIGSRETAQWYLDKVGPVVAPLFNERPSRRYRALTWLNDFERAYSDAAEGTKVLHEMIREISILKEELEAKIFDYIHLRTMGASFTLEDFEDIIRVYNRTFPTFNARYQRSSRLISELLERPTVYSSQFNSDLRSMDSALFRANQVWAQKEMTYFFFMRWLLNSIIVALSVALVMVSASALAAYPFSRMRFFGRRQGLLVLLLIQMFPAVMFMIALYALLQFLGRYIPSLGLDTLGGLVLVYSGGIAFNIWLIKGYFDTIPDTLEEAALIDGATRFQTFYKIVLPLARPILAVVAILTFMATFNEFVLAKIMLQNIDKWTYAVGLWQFSDRFETAWGPFTAAALVGAVPMLIFFLVLQDYIVGGLTKGAVKG